MTTSSTVNPVKAAINRARRQFLTLLGFRRGQLVVAVLVGAVLGGGFMAAAAGALGGEHDGGSGHSAVSESNQHAMDHFGSGSGER